ncbi:MAG: Asp-tRNA(Asn)/Glu-tRNA(Gln) amidotransferase subunit GatC [Proteobacteria bacterium]|nr:Asp-tRNA(Asn)/Glu-tRNA(Gln) amidotransferase subunit GatC [Pseudomonadota bacterium]
MSRIGRDEVEAIAELARLTLEPDEAERMTRDLDQILDYVAALQELDTSGIEPTSHAILLATPVRADQAMPGIDPETALANAPERAGSSFVVPKVIAGDEEG